MSDMMEPPFDGADENDPRVQLFQQEAQQLQEIAEKIKPVAERLGLYVEGGQIVPHDTPMGPKPGLGLVFRVGNVAFTDRVQNPDADSTNDQVKTMERQMAIEETDQLRDKVREALADGKTLDEALNATEEEDDLFDLDFSALAENDPDETDSD